MAAFLRKARISHRGLYSVSRVIRLPGETSEPILTSVFETWLRWEGLGQRL